MKKPRHPRDADDDPIICSCNGIRRSEILKILERGVRDPRTVGYATTAGQGECGGTCKPLIEKLIEEYVAGHPEQKPEKKKP